MRRSLAAVARLSFLALAMTIVGGSLPAAADQRARARLPVAAAGTHRSRAAVGQRLHRG